MEDQRIKEILIEKNDNFRKLYLEHQKFEQRLRDLGNKSYKSPDEMLEEQNIKKRKLMIKDAMQKIIWEYKEKAI